jgi:hypothetical protein
VKHSRGVELITRLVARPGEDVHVLTLASDTEAELADSAAGDALDAQARREYRTRLDQIARIVESAGLRNDTDAVEALEEERGLLERELSRATGLGGRSRPSGSLAERARVNVQRRVKEAILRIAEADPEVGLHLRRAVRTGTYCTYRP